MCVKARGVGAEPGGRWVQLSCSRWAIYRDNLCTPVEKRQICALKMATSGADWRISYAACVCLCVHIARNRMLWRFVKVCELGKNNKLLHTHNNQSCMPHTHTHTYMRTYATSHRSNSADTSVRDEGGRRRSGYAVGRGGGGSMRSSGLKGWKYAHIENSPNDICSYGKFCIQKQ